MLLNAVVFYVWYCIFSLPEPVTLQNRPLMKLSQSLTPWTRTHTKIAHWLCSFSGTTLPCGLLTSQRMEVINLKDLIIHSILQFLSWKCLPCMHFQFSESKLCFLLWWALPLKKYSIIPSLFAKESTFVFSLSIWYEYFCIILWLICYFLLVFNSSLIKEIILLWTDRKFELDVSNCCIWKALVPMNIFFGCIVSSLTWRAHLAASLRLFLYYGTWVFSYLCLVFKMILSSVK